MKKIILLLTTMLVLIEAKETYSLTIKAEPAKTNGKAWDIGGGAPDIFVKIDGIFVDFDRSCKNTYKCTINFTVTKGTSWYFEIYDKDLQNNDLIAKGNCSLGKECSLGGAKIEIEE